jgi:NDP-sugar pyrophosphorylase family protein
MKVVILAGGTGERLFPMTATCPKPILPIINKPALVHTILHLKSLGFTEMILQTHYLNNMIEETLKDGEELGVSIQYIVEKDRLGTAGCLSLSKKLLKETFLIVSGDLIFDCNLNAAIEKHIQLESLLTICTVDQNDCESYGNVLCKNEKVIKFIEKPSKKEQLSTKINTGIYIVDPSLIEMIPEGVEFDFSKQFIPLLLSLEIPIQNFNLSGYWIDFGTPRRFGELLVDWINGRIHLPIHVTEVLPNIYLGVEVKVSDSVKLIPPIIIGDRVTIEENCVIGPYAFITSEIKVKKDTHISNHAIINHFALKIEDHMNRINGKKLVKDLI